MGRLEELRINAYLSEVARGYGNNAFVAENLFPTIYSEKEKIDIFEFNKEAFNIYDTERAIRANSNVISPQGFKKYIQIDLKLREFTGKIQEKNNKQGGLKKK